VAYTGGCFGQISGGKEGDGKKFHQVIQNGIRLKLMNWPDEVSQAYNPSYLGSRDQEDSGSSPTLIKSS
jgi:hypothetical protein